MPDKVTKLVPRPPKMPPPSAAERIIRVVVHRVEVSPGIWWLFLVFLFMAIVLTEGRYR